MIKTMFDDHVAHALLRAVSALLQTRLAALS
jgi:hypothetical protein